MARLELFYLCICAAALTDGRAISRREEKRSRFKLRIVADAPDDSLLPGQCRVSGIALFDGAMWSPEPCSVCQCQKGTVSCHPVPCAGLNSHVGLSGAHKSRKPSPGAVEKEKITDKRKSLQRRGGSANLAAIPRAQEIKQRKETLSPPKTVESAIVLKPMTTKKNKQDEPVKPKIRTAIVSVTRRPDPVPDLKMTKDSLPYRLSDEDDDDDDDNDDPDDDDYDDDDYIGRTAGQSTLRDTARPAVRATIRPLLASTTGRGLTTAGGQAVLTTTRRPVPRAPGRPVVTFPQRPSFMESLPAGCLLSESLIACGSTGMSHIPILHDAGVKALYLADNRISKIPQRALAGLPNLEWLDLSKNKLDDSSFGPGLFQNLTKLRRLILDGNNLTNIPMFLPPSLLELKMNDNKLSGLTPSSFKGLSKLLTLELEDNRFHDGNVSPLTFRPLRKLIYLRLEDNKFRAIPSGLPVSLQELHLSDNRIEEVHAGILNKTVHLRLLDLSHNRIREDRISPRAWIHLLNLESLDLSHNKLVHVPSFLPVALRQLTLHHNQIERIPGYVFGHMRPGLDLLHLSNNRLRDDGIDDVSFLGLHTSLSELLLDHNHLHSIPRGLLKLKNLQLLRLNHNLISYIPLNALCDTHSSEDSPLVSVHLEYNLIDRRLIPPTAFSCIKTYHSIILRPQSHEDHE
ncbi:extracellular matrix protein 2 [Osmerus mordax]|uniref:extracellular matrix protein 2 n=1 Tax=Osmerus mordax TaxID=8014 RepID=UPI00350F9155